MAIASAVMLVVACASGVESHGQPNSAGPEDIATNLDVPWGIAFLPDGSAFDRRTQRRHQAPVGLVR